MLLGGLMLAGTAHAQVPPAPPASPASDAPIIPDSQFEAELPPLDPELDAPLEPIESFDIDAPAPPLPAPTENAAVPETVADATVPNDPALTEPLPPLATFDVNPPVATAEQDTAEPAPIRYSLEIQGLEEVELADRFRSLSALEDGDGEATNGAMIAARAREDEALAIRILRSEGYYDGTAVIALEQLPEEPARVRAVLTAAPGQRYNFGTIDITGPAPEPLALAREALELQTGQPIVSERVVAAEANINLELPQKGYPFVEVGTRDILLDPATATGDYTLPVESGPRSLFAGFTTEGDLAFDAEHVEVLSRFDRGQLYDSRLVDDLREAMVATNLFTSVSAEPVRTGELAPDGSEYVNILVRQDAGPARSITGSAGFGTGEGLRLQGAWEHRNLFPPEGGLRVGAVAGTREQAINVGFRRSNAGKRDRTFALNAEAGRRDYEAFRGYTARLSALMSRVSTPIWQKRWTYAFGAELIATNETREGEPRLSLGDAYFIGGLSGQLGYDTSNSLLDPTRGFRITGRVNPELSLGNGTIPYIRNQLDGSVYVPASDALTIAGRARVASIYGIERDQLAPSRRLYGGGGGSVRGFGYQELGPRDINNVPLGGRSQVEFSLEARYRFGNFGIVPFIDAGNVYESDYPTLSDMRFGVGIGGRMYTNFGPLRVDVAMPLGRREGENKFAVYISIGQAF